MGDDQRRNGRVLEEDSDPASPKWEVLWEAGTEREVSEHLHYGSERTH